MTLFSNDNISSFCSLVLFTSGMTDKPSNFLFVLPRQQSFWIIPKGAKLLVPGCNIQIKSHQNYDCLIKSDCIRNKYVPKRNAKTASIKPTNPPMEPIQPPNFN